MTRPSGTPETPKGRKGWKQNSNDNTNNWATNLSPSNPRLHDEPEQREGVPWKHLRGEDAKSQVDPVAGVPTLITRVRWITVEISKTTGPVCTTKCHQIK